MTEKPRCTFVIKWDVNPTTAEERGQTLCSKPAKFKEAGGDNTYCESHAQDQEDGGTKVEPLPGA